MSILLSGGVFCNPSETTFQELQKNFFSLADEFSEHSAGSGNALLADRIARF